MKGREIALLAARLADEKKGVDIVCYSVAGLSEVTDYMVVITAESKAQIRAIIESIYLELKTHGVTKLGREDGETGQWVLLDYFDCIIHVFSPQLREYYGLESLWGGSPRLDWQQEKVPAVVEQA